MDLFQITEVQCEYRSRLLGTDMTRPRFSWKLTSRQRDVQQSAYRLQLTTTDDAAFERIRWDSGQVNSSQSIQVPYAGPDLQARTAYWFRVKVWSDAGKESDWSELGQLETGMMQLEQWQAAWITPDSSQIERESEANFQLRHAFELDGNIASARIYATAAGVYELYMNGQPVSDDVLAPGWTSYHHRLQYQTYDVTTLLRDGGNVIGAWLGDGWYRGKLGFDDKQYTYGDHRALLLELHIRYVDGTSY